MTAPDRTLDLVRKLLAKAEDPGATPAEANAFNAKAADLMAAYGIERAMLAATGARPDAVGDRLVDVPAPWARDKAMLLAGIARALRCESAQLTRRAHGRVTVRMHLFGMTADLDRVDVLYTSLLVQAVCGLAAVTVPPWEHPAAYRRSWLEGFGAVVTDRLTAAEDYARQQAEPHGTGPSVALVLADRATLVSARYAEAYPNLATARSRRLRGTGWIEGERAGRRADLGGPRVAGPTRPAVTS